MVEKFQETSRWLDFEDKISCDQDAAEKDIGPSQGFHVLLKYDFFSKFNHINIFTLNLR